jgi:hypothetical protein
MTLPYERFQAIEHARVFLTALLDSTKTPRVPREVRWEARSVLKHFPQPYELKQLKSHRLFREVTDGNG